MTSGTAKLEFPLHPAVVRARDIILDEFKSIMMEEQNILEKENQRNKLIGMMPNQAAKDLLVENWNRYIDYQDPENSVTLWNLF